MVVTTAKGKKKIQKKRKVENINNKGKNFYNIFLVLGFIEAVALAIFGLIELDYSIIGALFYSNPSFFGLIFPYIVAAKDFGLCKKIYIGVNVVLHFIMLIYGFYWYYAPCEGWQCLNKLGIVTPFYFSLPVFLITTLIYWLAKRIKK